MTIIAGFFRLFFLLGVLLNVAPSAVALRQGRRGAIASSTSATTDNVLECEVYVQYTMVEETSGKGDEEDFVCFVDELVYGIPQAVVENYFAELKSPSPTTMYIEGGRLPIQTRSASAQSGEIFVPLGARIFFASTRRRLGTQKTIGTSTVLIMRVIASDVSTSMSVDTLYERILSDGSTIVLDRVVPSDVKPGTLTKTYRDCSFGKLNFVPATGYDIVKGVGFVTLDVIANGTENRAIENAVTTAINLKYGSTDNFDHIM